MFQTIVKNNTPKFTCPLQFQAACLLTSCWQNTPIHFTVMVFNGSTCVYRSYIINIYQYIYIYTTEVRELNNVLLRDLGERIALSSRWPLVPRPGWSMDQSMKM